MIKLNLKTPTKPEIKMAIKSLIQNEWENFYCSSLSPLEALCNGIYNYILLISFMLASYLFITDDPFIYQYPFKSKLIIVGTGLYWVLLFNKKYYLNKK